MTPPLSVTVAALTRRRPLMLANLIDSFAALRIPEGCTVRFLIVENDTDPLSRDTVAHRAPLPGGALDYVLEPEPGIPFGRNRAAKEAIAAGHDLLAFVDDDEVVAEDWLVNLIAGYRQSGAVLLGAPLGIHPPQKDLSWIQVKMHDCIRRRYAKKATRAARRADLTGTPGVTIVTNNWLGETGLFAEHGIWFDEAMRYTGGTDAKFSAQVKEAGLPTAWIADAHVHEIVPPERLSFGYQFARGRDQSNTNFRRKIDGNPAARWTVLVTVPLKAVSALGLAVALVPTNGATMLDLARTTGWIAGRLGAIAGARSDLYRQTTGH
ncbi:glycosyltransferase [Palleronia abyssalis]|uniref:Glycosyltransferase 2-like domain-containing protein n=1 Tax=Palleronia abyssalis TaxID=1501240 RepID=A0A2R8C0P9_9RHOB|nr:glycosyltransferase [Palleronia abyssalis]SPJ25995.1 hypothetical protein PAA8504_03851 [Palleronia abyssalis]